MLLPSNKSEGKVASFLSISLEYHKELQGYINYFVSTLCLIKELTYSK